MKEELSSTNGGTALNLSSDNRFSFNGLRFFSHYYSFIYYLGQDDRLPLHDDYDHHPLLYKNHNNEHACHFLL